MRYAIALAASTAVALGAGQGPAVAADQEAALERVTLEEVIVTARKREESLLEVPLSITALTSADISEAGVVDVSDITRLAPSFSFPGLGARYIDTPIIRGVTGNDSDPTKQSASFFVDGIYVSGSVGGLDMQDVERVEVIKGPQSALFGRATYAGAINFITKQPSSEFTGRVSASLVQDDERELAIGFSGPLVADRLFFRVSGRYFEYGGEWVNGGIPAGYPLGDISTRNGSASLLFNATDNLRIRARVEYIRDKDGPAAVEKKSGADQNCRFVLSYICGPVDFNEARAGYTIDELLAEGYNPGIDRETWRQSLTADWELPGFTVSLVGAYNDEQTLRPWDVVGDLVKNPIFIGFGGAQPGTWGGQIVQNFFFRDYSTELRLTSTGEGPFSWIVGAFYTEANQKFGRIRGAITVDPPNRRRLESESVFGQVAWQFTDRLRATAEGRYQRETLQRLNFVTKQPLVLGGGIVADRTFTEFLPRVTIDYRVPDKYTVYAQFSKGNKPGDFNLGNVPAEFVVLEEEQLDNYEIGIKASLLENRLSASFALFHMDLKNQQVRDVTPQFTFLTRNTGESRSRGAEIDLTFLPFEDVALRAVVGYADFEYTNYVNDANAQQILGNGNVNGNVSRNTPKWTGSLSVDVERPIAADLRWFSRADVSYRGKVYGDESNVNWLEPLTLVNLRFGLTNGSWRGELFARNLLDDDTPQRLGINTDFSRFPVASPRVVSVVPTRSRQVGARVSYQF
jgi:iron complex outermembrane recepter protein